MSLDWSLPRAAIAVGKECRGVTAEGSRCMGGGTTIVRRMVGRGATQSPSGERARGRGGGGILWAKPTDNVDKGLTRDGSRPHKTDWTGLTPPTDVAQGMERIFDCLSYK
jgi:hypothetical protein